MVDDPYSKDWVTVYCPVCNERLGQKKRDEIDSFECPTDGCSKTEHWFYPGQIKRPGRSVPWSSYYKKKKGCGCGTCAPPEPD